MRLRILVVIATLMLVAGASLMLLDAAGAPDTDATPPQAMAVEPDGPLPALPTAAASIPTAVPAPCPACGQDESLWRSFTGVQPPELLGKSAALLEGSCGRQIFGHASHERMLPASLVKIASALAVRDQRPLTDMIDSTIDGWDLTAQDGSSIMGLKPGMRLSIEELLHGLLLPSGNDAALTLADALGGQENLVRAMNRKARTLGLRDTRFQNAHGLDADGQYSTAFDMTVLGAALLQDPVLAKMVATQSVPASWSDRPLWNGNYLLYIYPDTVGVKTGWTEGAGGTIVAAASRGGRLLIASVFNSADVYYDSMRLFNWAYASTPPVC